MKYGANIMANMADILKYQVKMNASDVHLCAGRKPYLRIHGELMDTEFPVLGPDDVKRLIYSVLTEQQIKTLEEDNELDLSYIMPDLCRFRLNVYRQRGSYAVSVRAIPFQVEPFDDLGIPLAVKDFANNMHGLVLVTGPQGSGKTTTLAAILDHINSTSKSHVITIEDPIEYVHRSKRSIINQREIAKDTASYKTAMKYLLRQDVDVCLIGEIRDQDTVETALALAEAGVLVLSTLHSPSAAESISRIVDMFPPEYQAPLKNQLSLALKAVVAQQLIPRKDEKGRVLACEIMTVTHSIHNMIKHFSIKQIYSMIQTGRAEGMQTMDQALLQLYSNGKISRYELKRRAFDVQQVMDEVRKIELHVT
ncbi:MAG: PilT/PilU family type 4a pilus ATPase [Candidatus Omnitrophica bacterium]|nr:PilT/PilU family type 4a pilus ATPase [Candidatus Omnitrophota bacterium]